MAGRRSSSLLKRKRVVVGTSVRQTEIVAFAEQPVIVCETFLVGRDISIQTFPTWHPKPVSGCRQECVLEDRGDSGLQSWWRLFCGRCRAVCSFGAGNAKVMGSSPTVVVRVGVIARGGTGTPARLY